MVSEFDGEEIGRGPRLDGMDMIAVGIARRGIAEGNGDEFEPSSGCCGRGDVELGAVHAQEAAAQGFIFYAEAFGVFV